MEGSVALRTKLERLHVACYCTVCGKSFPVENCTNYSHQLRLGSIIIGIYMPHNLMNHDDVLSIINSNRCECWTLKYRAYLLSGKSHAHILAWHNCQVHHRLPLAIF